MQACALAAVPRSAHRPLHCCPAEFEAFAFQDADDYSLEEFEGIAATFEEQWFGADRDKARAGCLSVAFLLPCSCCSVAFQ